MVTKCPKCKAPLQGTIKVHLSDIVLADNSVKSFSIYNRQGLYEDFESAVGELIEGAEGDELHIYCENDHNLTIDGRLYELSTGAENQVRDRELHPSTVLKAHGYKARRVKGGKYNLIRIEDSTITMANVTANEVGTFARNLQERNGLLQQDKERARKRASR